MDTVLSEIQVFKLLRAETAARTVATQTIVITLNIIEHLHPHYFPATKALSVDTFHFPREKEAFHASIVITATFGTYVPMQIMPFQ